MSKRTARKNGGFTLVELLCTIVVLLLISALMVTGIQLGVRTLRRSVTASESQVLCSTLKTVVSDELRYSGTITQTADGFAFFSQNYGEAVSFTTNEDGQVLLGGNKLLPKRSYPYGMQAAVTIRSYQPLTRVFDVEITVLDRDGGTLAETSYQVKQLNEPVESELLPGAPET